MMVMEKELLSEEIVLKRSLMATRDINALIAFVICEVFIHPTVNKKFFRVCRTVEHKLYDLPWMLCEDFAFPPWVTTRGQRVMKSCEAFQDYKISNVRIHSALFVEVSLCML